MDLAEAAEFDLAAARRNIEGVRPGMRIFEVSSKTGHGMDQVVAFLEAQLERSRAETEETSATVSSIPAME
jgi:hydrogenase nickel incorporation protein HypB